MPRVRLSPFVRVIPTGTGALLHSDRGTFALEEIDVALFSSLLDGSRDLESAAAALGDDVEEGAALLAELRERGLLEPVPAEPPDGIGERWRLQARHLQGANAGEEPAMERVRGARLLVAGLEPWGLAAAAELAAAGVGALHLLDDGCVTPPDLLAARELDAGAVGRPRGQALQEALSSAAPWCAVTRGSLSELLEGGAADGAPWDQASWDLAIGALDADDVGMLRAFARFAHRAGLRSLYGALKGSTAFIGPAVVPGHTACWSCCQARLLANAGDPAAEFALSALLARTPGRTPRSWAGPAAALLGGALALEALAVVAGSGSSRLVGRLLVQDLRTLEATLHAVVPLPWCQVCGGAAGMEGGAAPAELPAEVRTAGDLREALPGWIDRRTGVIRHLVTDRGSGPEAGLPVCAVAALGAYTDGVTPPVQPGHGYGKGLSEGEALLTAVGEAFEHYAAGRMRLDDLRYGRLGDLPGEALDPRRLCLYSEAQYRRPGFPFAPFEPERPLYWTEGRWLDTGEPVWVPAAAVYLNPEVGGDAPLFQITSNGLAAGVTLEDAALRAVLELVERDALLLTWLCRLPGRRLRASGALDPGSEGVLRRLGELGARTELYLLDVGLSIPTVACVGLGDGERWPAVTLGLGTHLSPRRAARKAILELGQTGPYLRRLMAEGEAPIPEEPEEVRSLRDHALFYLPARRAAAFDFLRSDGREAVELVSLEEPEDGSLGACLEPIGAAGVRIAAVDVSSPDVALSPFRVVRALGTELQPVTYGWGLDRLASPRLGALLTGPLNPFPHPLC